MNSLIPVIVIGLGYLLLRGQSRETGSSAPPESSRSTAELERQRLLAEEAKARAESARFAAEQAEHRRQLQEFGYYWDTITGTLIKVGSMFVPHTGQNADGGNGDLIDPFK